MKPEVLYATTNPGKLLEVSDYLHEDGFEVKSLRDVGITDDVPETGITLEENARIKAEARMTQAPGMIVLTDDTGVEISALNGEPGVFVRRWKDHENEMTDEEIIEYCIERLAGAPEGERDAQFRTVIAVGFPDGEIVTVDGTLQGRIVTEPIELRVEGFPFESLFFCTEWDMMLGDQHALPPPERNQLLTHRTKAVRQAADLIRQHSS